MPRTKLNKKITNKRNRVSNSGERYATFCTDLRKEVEKSLTEFEIHQADKWGTIQRSIQNLRSKLPQHILNMTVGEMEELLNQGVKTFDQVNEIYSQAGASAANLTHAHTINASVFNSSARPVSRTDDGYNTGDSLNSDVSRAGSSSAKPKGPFQSAKAKARRRSRSVSSVLNQNKLTRTQPIGVRIAMTPNDKSRQSRSRFRTPMGNRIQTMSADRCMGPVTPKVQVGATIAMLRYAKQGETVISLDGSPVIASNIIGNGANINIPTAHGVFTIQPSCNGVVDANVVSQIDSNTLEDLRRLQDNLDMIMQAAAEASCGPIH